MSRVRGSETQVADQSQFGEPVGFVLANLSIRRHQPPFGRADVRTLAQQRSGIADRNRRGQRGQLPGGGQFDIERAGLAAGENGQLVERLGNLRVERYEGLTRVLDLGADPLDIEVGCNALLAALLGERQYALFEFSRLAYQGDTLLLVAQIDIGLGDLG